MRTQALLSISTAIATAGLASLALADTYSAVVTLNAANEVPPNSSTATGTAFVSINSLDNTLTFSMTYSGLSSPETAAHIHGYAPPGMNAPVVFLLPSTLGSKSGVWNYLETDEHNILSGLAYMNIHTMLNP